ncbi:carbohydrate-binding family 9-like protein [Pedobacter sp. L105]|uniref:carbohydrate-binding family 9-like protein n=1 Tax=Pedobacter sp. L105 TaxID=1641871 RepID=UPI00131E8CB8|nr:carbohydrate-binding family 9-like protein [Pedobacter sp. L105]
MLYKASLKPLKFIRKPALLSLISFPLIFSGVAQAQESFKGLESLFTVPKQYTAMSTTAAPVIDGDISDKLWSNVPWTDNFTDIEGDKQPAPYFNTRLKMMWDKNYLYIAAEVKDPHVWANVKKHDEVVFQDNDFEIFIDPNNHAHQYFEIEVNAINTIWDLFLPKPYRNNGGGLASWEALGMRSAVRVQGTLNNPSDTDKGWTVEMAIPFSALRMGNGNMAAPQDGESWRINFSRVEWGTTVKDGHYVKNTDSLGKNLPEHNWVWSPQGLINMHYPERWGYLKFSAAPIGQVQPPFELPYAEKQRNYLWLVYYRQKEYLEKQGKYAVTLEELGIKPTFELEGITNTLDMEATNHQFYLSLKADKQSTLTINQEGLVQIEK